MAARRHFYFHQTHFVGRSQSPASCFPSTRVLYREHVCLSIRSCRVRVLLRHRDVGRIIMAGCRRCVSIRFDCNPGRTFHLKGIMGSSNGYKGHLGGRALVQKNVPENKLKCTSAFWFLPIRLFFKWVKVQFWRPRFGSHILFYISVCFSQ